jgi:hypothetical protein
MNWIRKAFIFVSFLIISFFASQANQLDVQKIEIQKTDPNFSVENTTSSAFIQPQEIYQLTASIKTNHPSLVKWFDSLVLVIPSHKVLRSTSNFANQFHAQSKKVLLLLYPFHNFW